MRDYKVICSRIEKNRITESNCRYTISSCTDAIELLKRNNFPLTPQLILEERIERERKFLVEILSTKNRLQEELREYSGN